MSTQRRPTLDEVTQRDWRSDNVLEELHVRRGWTPTDIARKYQADVAQVKRELRERGLYQEDQNGPPKQGLARKLWERGLNPDAGGDSH